jgi:uncharacterized protein YjbJ (UPF0337 family)
MPMNKDRVKGAATRTGGKKAEGRMDQAKGKARNAMGSAKDALK